MAEQLGRRQMSPLLLTFIATVAMFFAAFLIYPLLYVFKEAFWVNGTFSLIYFRQAIQNPVTGGAIWNSILLGLTATAATTLIAVPLGFISARLRFPGKSILIGLMLVPMIMPPFVGAIGMNRLLAKYGTVNLLLGKLGLPAVDFLGGGFWVVVVLQALHLFPIMYLNVAAALANIDPSLEEAARNMGDSGFRLFRRVTFPLMLPGYFAGAVLVFIWSFTDLGTPLIFNYDRVVAVKLFNQINDINTNPAGYALVVVLVLLSAGMFLLTRLYVGRRGYQMLSKGVAARRETEIGPRGSMLIWCVLLGLLAVALIPHLGVVLTSLAGKWSDTILPTEITGSHYVRIWQESDAIRGIRNSLMLSCASTALNIVLGVGIAYVLVRKRFVGAGMLDAMSMMPLAVPGIVLAFGYLGAFSGTLLDPQRNPFPLLIIAYTVRRMPYMVRAAYAGFQQTSVSLEEAAMNVGATPMRALLKITAPLIMANLIAGAILSFSFAMLEVSDSLILADRNHAPITRAIYDLHSSISLGDNIACAMGVLAMVLLAATLLLSARLLGKRMGQLFRL